MNKRIVVLSFAALLMSLTAGFSAAAQTQRNFTGAVSASQIASTGGESSVGLWMKKLNCHDQADCTRQLVRAGGQNVLLTSNGVYQFVDQDKVAPFAGMRVIVSGVRQGPDKTIRVADVEVYDQLAATSAGVQ